LKSLVFSYPKVRTNTCPVFGAGEGSTPCTG
jgi:hypothetical protein